MTPSPAQCVEVLRLRAALLQAVSEVNRLQTLEVESVIGGQIFPFKAKLEQARFKWRGVKRALLAHIHEHGCAKDARVEEAGETDT